MARLRGIAATGIRHGATALAVAAVLLGIGVAQGQQPAAAPRLPGAVEPGRPTAPTAPAPVPQADFDFQIQQRVGGDTRGTDTLRFRVARIIVEGATVYSDAELADLTESLADKNVTLGDVTAIAEEIEGRYRAAGYVLTRVFVPAQRVGDGNFRINVVEGYVQAVSVEGAPDGLREIIEGYLDKVTAERPSRLATIERGLLLVQDLSGVSAAGVLRPGDDVGATELVVTVRERPYEGIASINNRGSQFAGPTQIYAEARLNNFFDFGEQFAVGVTGTGELAESRGFLFRWVQPVGNDGTVLQFDGNYSYGLPGFRLKELDVRTRGLRYGIRVRHPIIRSRLDDLNFEIGYTWQRSQASALGATFTYDVYTTLDARLNWRFSDDLGGANLLGLSITQGVPNPTLGTSRTGASGLSRQGAEPNFTRANLEFQRVQPLDWGVSLATLLSVQYSMSKLFAGEEFSLGGRIGRGYDPAEISGPHGVGGTVELRYDNPDNPWLQPFFFWDLGQIFTRTPSSPSLAIQSIGFGVRMQITDDVTVNAEVGRPISRVPAVDGTERKLRFGVDLTARF